MKKQIKFKNINMKHHTTCFVDDITNIKKFGWNNIEADEKSHKNFFIYCIGYVTIKDIKYVKINNVNHLYLIINKVNEYFEEINGNKYLMFVPTNKCKKIIAKKKNCE